MRFTANIKALTEAFAPVERVARGNRTIPILTHARLTVRDAGIAFAGCDLDRWIHTNADAAVAAPGATMAPAAMFADALRSLPKDGEAAFELDDKFLTIRCGRARIRLATLPVEDFPEFSEPAAEHMFDLPADFPDRLAAVAHAMSAEETRYYLNGVYLECRDGRARLVATDGHRLMLADLPGDAPPAPPVILPAETVREFLAIAKAAGAAKLSLAIGERSARLRAPRLTLSSKVIEGTFPDYTRVIPPRANERLRFESEALDAAARRASVAAEGKSTRIKLSHIDDRLILETLSIAAGAEARDEIDVEGSGLTGDVGFNCKYLLEGLRALGGATVEMSMADPGAPARFDRVDREDRFVVLMPLRV